MNLSLETILSYAQSLVFGALAWAWKLDGRITALEARHSTELANLRIEFQGALHQLELTLRSETVRTADFQSLEDRIEKRVGRMEAKIDEALGIMRGIAAARPTTP